MYPWVSASCIYSSIACCSVRERSCSCELEWCLKQISNTIVGTVQGKATSFLFIEHFQKNLYYSLGILTWSKVSGLSVIVEAKHNWGIEDNV